MALVTVLFFLLSIGLSQGNQDFVTREEFTEVLSRLEITNGKLSETTSTLAETTANLAETMAELNEVKAEVTQLKEANEGLQEELDFLKELFAHENLDKPEPNRAESIEERVEYLEQLSKLKHARTCAELQAHGVTKSG